MNTYHFVEINGDCALVLSAENEKEAWARLAETGLRRDEWRLDTVEDEDSKTPRERHAEDYPEDAMYRKFDGGF